MKDESYAKSESTLLLATKGEPFDNNILVICSSYGDDLDQHTIISTRNLQYLGRFLMALIRIELAYHFSLIDCVS